MGMVDEEREVAREVARKNVQNIKAAIADMERLLADAEAEVSALSIPSRLREAEMIHWQMTHHGGRLYTYGAVRVGPLWYRTGGLAPRHGQTLGNLVEWIRASRGETETKVFAARGLADDVPESTNVYV